MPRTSLSLLAACLLLSACRADDPTLEPKWVGALGCTSLSAPAMAGTYCEERRYEGLAPGKGASFSSRNGSLDIEGGNPTVNVAAQVYARAATVERAQEMVQQIHIRTRDNRFYADGPRERQGEVWGVSFRATVPAEYALSLSAINGVLQLQGVGGHLLAQSINGAVILEPLRGTVVAGSINGGTYIRLVGDRWEGSGIKARALNGHLVYELPRSYKADVRLQAINGSIRSDFQGGESRQQYNQQSYRIRLNGGGSRLEGETMNGNAELRADPLPDDPVTWPLPRG